jgi:VWFA-related protein
MIALLTLLLPLWYPQDTLEVDVNLVSIFATVQDEAGQFVEGLDVVDFRVLEDGREQPVEIFEAQGGLSTSLGVLVDNSGSSSEVLRSVKAGLPDFISSLDPADEAFVMSFGTSARIIYEFGDEDRAFRGTIDALRPFGTSVLFDALDSGIRQFRAARNPRHALIVMTDGNDNGSRSSYTDVIDAAESNMVLLYFIGIGPGILVDTYTLNGLASMTGGSVVMLGRDRTVREALEEIRDDLGRQYYLAYHASSTPGFHRIEVQVRDRDLRIRAREGYRVP